MNIALSFPPEVKAPGLEDAPRGAPLDMGQVGGNRKRRRGAFRKKFSMEIFMLLYF
ncbi:MAG: hypothetical protein J0H41_17960 [Rhizobiales bacterium]|nr:hypothetical protein [Hyphomicrobiales bacterium]